jgi:hypothetical protein
MQSAGDASPARLIVQDGVVGVSRWLLDGSGGMRIELFAKRVACNGRYRDKKPTLDAHGACTRHRSCDGTDGPYLEARNSAAKNAGPVSFKGAASLEESRVCAKSES